MSSGCQSSPVLMTQCCSETARAEEKEREESSVLRGDLGIHSCQCM